MHKCEKKKKGQISLEFLVVLVAMIAILIVFMPVFSKLQKSVLLALDVYSASSKLNEFKTNVSMLNTLETGSSFIFEYKFINGVQFECKDDTVKFILANSVQAKELYLDIILNCDYDKNAKINRLLIEKSSQTDINISALS